VHQHHASLAFSASLRCAYRRVAGVYQGIGRRKLSYLVPTVVGQHGEDVSAPRAAVYGARKPAGREPHVLWQPSTAAATLSSTCWQLLLRVGPTPGEGRVEVGSAASRGCAG
jgi:hypothetical protein